MGKMIRRIAAAAGVLVMLLAQSAAAQNNGKSSYVIGGGDVLEVNVWRNAELSRTVTVRPDGMVSLPLIHDIRASGSTTEELQVSITEALIADNLVSAPSVSVSVVQVVSYRVYTLGAVATNGMFPLIEQVTALQLLAQAGGPAEGADLLDAYILRNKVKIAVDLRYDTAEKVQPDNPMLVPGDVLVLPGRVAPREEPVHRILIVGEVANPQAMPFQEGITVLGAFAEAGGGTEFADTDSVKVIRREEGQEDRVIEVNLEKVMKKGDLKENIDLVPGDIVIVP